MGKEDGGGGCKGKMGEMQSHVLSGRVLPSPLLIFNEAKRNIMQMSLNGPIPAFPFSFSSSPHPLPTSFFCPRQFSVYLYPYLPPFLFIF